MNVKPISRDLVASVLFDHTEIQVLEEATEAYDEQCEEARKAICADNNLTSQQLEDALESIFYKQGAIKRVRRWIDDDRG